MSQSQSINFTISPSELTTLASHAISAKSRAYCPYSNFRVGACFLTSTDRYCPGANVEVASTPVGICAERCALAPLVASIARPEMPLLRALAVSTDIWPPASPCGMCRQMIREFCQNDMKVYMYGRKSGPEYRSRITPEEELQVCGEPAVMTIGELLPMSFGPQDMDKRQ